MKIRTFAILLFAITFLFASGAVDAQITQPKIRWVSTLPSKCSTLRADQALVYKYTATTGLYRCTATDTYTALGSGGAGTMAIGGSVTSGTQGSIYFGGASGALAQDNAGLFWDDTNNQLKLTPSAATQNPLLIKLHATQSGNAIEVQPNGSTTPIWKVDANGYADVKRLYVDGVGAITRPSGFNEVHIGLDSGSRPDIVKVNTAAFQIGTGFDTTHSISSDTGYILRPKTVTAIGTTGAQTIDKVSGTINIAAGQSSVVLTSSGITANSIVLAVMRTNDATATHIRSVVPAAGSATITLNANATATVSIGFFIAS